ncbi:MULTISPECIES: O-antigen ligase family protein [unclassified Halobacteriovorax]|uniref:O-antigen ligase family protein n=1 Tax=unclassified Halobacteriovorax TaxID=2639665 RepID=UPI00399A37C7
MNYLIFFSIVFTTLGICFSPSLLGVGDILMLFPIIYSAYWAYKNKIKLPVASKFLILTFAISCIMSFIAIDDTSLAIKAVKKSRYFLIGALSFYPLYHFFNSNNKLKDFVKKYYMGFFLACFATSFAYGLFQIIQNEGNIFALLSGARMPGSIHITKFAYISSFTASLVISFISLLKLDRGNKKSAIALAALSVVGVLVAKTRGALLSLLVSLSATIYYKSKKLALVLFSAFIILIGLMIALQSTEFAKSTRFLTLKNNSTSYRISLYEAGIKIFQEKPLTGYGYKQSVNEIERVKTQYNIDHPQFIERIHHTFLEIAADIGIFGLLAFSGWFFSWGYLTLVSPSAFTKSTLALVINAFVCAQFDVFNQTVMFAFILLAFNMSLVTDRLARNKLNE